MDELSRKAILSAGILLVAMGAWANAAVAQQERADVILANGKIITVDERFRVAQAVAVKDERIVAVGSTAEIERLGGPNTRRIDLQGKAVIPGLIENHAHFLRAGATWLREVRLDGVTSRKQAVERLRARARAAAPGVGFHVRGLGPPAVHGRSAALFARRTGRDCAEQSGNGAGGLLPNLPEQPRAGDAGNRWKKAGSKMD